MKCLRDAFDVPGSVHDADLKLHNGDLDVMIRVYCESAGGEEQELVRGWSDRSRGHFSRVETAAVELCRKKNPDVVLLDLEMPVFDGMTAAETIINENLAGCVVICTAFADEDFLEQAGRIGVSGYIVKPVEARNLRPTIEMAYAQGRRLAKQKLAIGEANRRLEENRVIERAN